MGAPQEAAGLLNVRPALLQDYLCRVGPVGGVEPDDIVGNGAAHGRRGCDRRGHLVESGLGRRHVLARIRETGDDLLQAFCHARQPSGDRDHSVGCDHEVGLGRLEGEHERLLEDLRHDLAELFECLGFLEFLSRVFEDLLRVLVVVLEVLGMLLGDVRVGLDGLRHAIERGEAAVDLGEDPLLDALQVVVTIGSDVRRAVCDYAIGVRRGLVGLCQRHIRHRRDQDDAGQCDRYTSCLVDEVAHRGTFPVACSPA